MISLRDVSKRFGDVTALEGVSLDVHPGEIYALLGLNGAGKTTVMRVVLGMIRPSTGQVELDRRPLSDRAVWARVGYSIEAPSAYPELTVRENLDVIRRLRGLTRRPVADAVDRFGLAPFEHRRARTLSQGNARRLALARALLHRPSLIVLDEPVNGLDPAGVVEVRLLLTELAREEGASVLLSSHQLVEVDRLATRIGVLHRGRLVEEFDAAALRNRVRPRLEVDALDRVRATALLRGHGYEVRVETDALILEADRAVRHPGQVAEVLVHGGEPPTRLAVVVADLEEQFLGLVASAPAGDTGSDHGR